MRMPIWFFDDFFFADSYRFIFIDRIYENRFIWNNPFIYFYLFYFLSGFFLASLIYPDAVEKYNQGNTGYGSESVCK